MIKLQSAGLLLTALMISASVYAADIQVDEAWAIATPPGRTSANVYLLISSKQAATLVGASSAASRTVALRTMIHKSGTMKTIEVNSVDLPANNRIDMTSEHGYHLTLIDLKAPLKAGDTLPVTLNIDTADKRSMKVDIKAEVRPPKKALQ